MNSSFRYHLTSLSLLVVIVVTWAAIAQVPIVNISSAGPIEDLITQLKRISNAHSQLLNQFQQEISDNKDDINSLRGQIQENQYRLNQIIECQKRILSQINNLNNKFNLHNPP